ncbi:MAG: SLC13 family permease, partial [Planctomycetota bacterium]|nr:SLC13 family permease [Planctomycetota bacterium]
ILGGTCSLIGTSTNLVVAGLVIAQNRDDLRKLGMFDITTVGLPVAIIGGLFLIFVGPKLLPSRGAAVDALDDPREYTAEMTIPTGSPIIGRSIEEAGLRNLPGAYLIEIERGGESIVAVGPEQRLRENDRLVFVGVVDSIRDLQNLRGLQPATDQVFKLDSPRYRRRLFEAVVSDTCPMVGKTIREGRFRTTYGAAVIGVARNGERLRGKIGDIELQPGDTLLTEADPSFGERLRDSRDFFLVSALEDSTPRRHERAPIALAILAGVVITATIGVLDMLQAALVGAGLMVLTRCCTVSEGRRSVDWSVLVVIAAALGLGAALEVSGAARLLADGLMSVAGGHPWLALIAVYIATSILTEIITNNAAVALTFPVALSASDALGVDFMPFVVSIMMAGSASFATPLGYQTTLMVYGPGGYAFTDFMKIGLPMNVLAGVVTCAIAPLFWGF